LARDQVRTRPFGPYEDYLSFVRGWRVGVAPLASTGFNNARSDTKFATYAACGIAPVLEAHPVHAAHADAALLFGSADEFTHHLERLRADQALLQQVRLRAHSWACRERSAEKLREQRVAFYESLATARKGRSAQPGSNNISLVSFVGASPVEQLRRSHAAWGNRLDFLRALLSHQPYDYIALRTVITEIEAAPDEGGELESLYQRLCLVAPEAVPPTRRPLDLREFMPDERA